MKKAFTIIELLKVVIIGILASVAIPQYTKALKKAKTAEALINLGALRGAMDRYWYKEIALGEYENDCQLITGEDDDARGRELELDVDNPNNPHSANRDWAYGLLDLGAMVEENQPVYVLEARMIPFLGDAPDLWIQMDQDGRVAKARELGGDGDFLPGADGHVPHP